MRTLAMMWGRAKGRTIFRNASAGPAPSEAAASRYARGTLRTPWCAPRRVTTATPLAIRRIFEASPYPNQITYSGRRASAGVNRKSVTQGSARYSTLTVHPVARPRKIPTSEPRTRPTSTLVALTAMLLGRISDSIRNAPSSASERKVGRSWTFST